jgi:hypothetical protein
VQDALRQPAFNAECKRIAPSTRACRPRRFCDSEVTYKSPMLRITCRLWSNIRSMVVVLLCVCPTSPISPRWNGYTLSCPDCRRRRRRPSSAKRHTPPTAKTRSC